MREEIAVPKIRLSRLVKNKFRHERAFSFRAIPPDDSNRTPLRSVRSIVAREWPALFIFIIASLSSRPPYDPPGERWCDTEYSRTTLAGRVHT